MSYDATGTHPVVGKLEPFFDGRFGSFDTPTIHGLARVEGDRLEILAVVAPESGRGDFTRFLDQCVEAYRDIAIWEIWNKDLEAFLLRRGFVSTNKIDDGERVDGLVWHGAVKGAA